MRTTYVDRERDLMYTCSKCLKALNEDAGCVFCLDFKQKYMTYKDEFLEVKAVKVGNRALKLASRDLEKLQRVADTTPEHDPNLSREIAVVIKNITTLMDSIRKLEKEQGAGEESLTFAEKKVLIKDFVGSLPPMLRKDMMRELLEAYGNGVDLKAV